MTERQLVRAVLVSDTENWVYKGRAHAYDSHGSAGVKAEWHQFTQNQQLLAGNQFFGVSAAAVVASAEK